MDADGDDLLQEVEEEEGVEIDEDFSLTSGRTGGSYQVRIGPKRSLPVLGLQARAKLISTRAKQIDMGDPPRILRAQLKSTRSDLVANQEIEEKVLPIKLRRFFPDGFYEDWSIKDFKYFK